MFENPVLSILTPATSRFSYEKVSGSALEDLPGYRKAPI
jgi:hypothetical protein